MYIAIAGNIGSGKTTLTELLAKHYEWKPQFEDVDDNPYLFDFYSDMERWAFHLQMFFLGKRFRQIIENQQSEIAVVQDRTIFEDAHIFAANLHDMGLLSSNDYATYMAIYTPMNTLLAPPDLLIYIRASVPTLIEQIKKRGRAYESGIRVDYLSKLNEKYEAWFAEYPHRKLVVDVNDNNFVTTSADLDAIIANVNNSLNINTL
jgi:deoxyadenosine/deoxycytidine kinase